MGGGRRGAGGAGGGRKSNDSAGGEEMEDVDEAVACAQAGKGRGTGGGKAKGGDGEEEEEWDTAEEIIPCLPDLQAMKVPALKDLCGRHGMKKTGKKEDLVQRLHDKALAQGDGVGIGAGICASLVRLSAGCWCRNVGHRGIEEHGSLAGTPSGCCREHCALMVPVCM